LSRARIEEKIKAKPWFYKYYWKPYWITKWQEMDEDKFILKQLTK
jgi:ABC-type proline/glycine betaine transport system substrate-binding protein